MSFIKIDPENVDPRDMHQFIIGGVSPRPIALVSSIGIDGSKNLAPYSFFNAFSSNPPILVFSSNLKGGNDKEKDTLKNIRQTKNCVINMVSYAIVRQMTLSSIAYEYGVSEFEKSGLTPIKSDLVDAFRVKESPVQFECTIEDIIAIGNEAGAANLIICKILKMHVLKTVLTEDLRRIDPNKLDVMGRLGRSNYVRVKGNNVIEMYQSTTTNCIGYDKLPIDIQRSKTLTGNDIAELASVERVPSKKKVWSSVKDLITQNLSREEYHQKAADLILKKDKNTALMVALIPEYFIDA